MRNYKDVQVWEKAHRLTLAVYKGTQDFPKEERFGLTSQIRRSSASIAAPWRKAVAEDRMVKWRDTSRFRWARAPSSPITCCWRETWFS